MELCCVCGCCAGALKLVRDFLREMPNLDELFGFRNDTRFVDYTSKLVTNLDDPASLILGYATSTLLSDSAAALYRLNFDTFYSQQTDHLYQILFAAFTKGIDPDYILEKTLPPHVNLYKCRAKLTLYYSCKLINLTLHYRSYV